MEDPIVIKFDGSVDCEFFQLLKQIALNQASDQVDQNIRLLTSVDSLQILHAELDKQNQIQDQLTEEHALLNPDFVKVFNTQEACGTLQQKVHDLTEENKRLENGTVQMRKKISEKRTYKKLQSLLGKSVKELGTKNKALKKERERVLKKYDKVNLEAFKYKVKEREADFIIQGNESLLEQIKDIRRNTQNLHVMNIVSHHVTQLKEEHVKFIDQLRRLNQNQKNVYDKDGDIELKMLQTEQRAYLECNKALEQEKAEVMRKKMNQQRIEFKILQERGYVNLLMKSNTELQQEVENTYGSLRKGGLLELGLTSDLRLDELIEIQKTLRPEVGTQTTVVNLEMPDGLKQAGLMTADGKATVVEETGARTETFAEKCEIETQTMEEEFGNGKDLENSQENSSPTKLEKGKWNSDEYF